MELRSFSIPAKTAWRVVWVQTKNRLKVEEIIVNRKSTHKWAMIPVRNTAILGPGGHHRVRQSYFFLKILFYWSIVDVQCCVHFCCTAKWFSYTYIYILFHIPFHYGLSQDIEYSSLCSTVGPCCLSILYIIVCIC